LSNDSIERINLLQNFSRKNKIMEIKKNILDKKLYIGAGAIMLAALFWSLDGVFIRPKLYQLPADLVVFLEHGLGFIVLVPFIFIGWNRIKLLRTNDWLAIMWVCLFGGLIGTLMITKAFFAAMDGSITFATVVILQKLQPVFALLMARLILKEKLNSKFYLWAVLAIVAGYFLAFGKSGLNISQINFFHSAAFFAGLAAFAFGSSTVFGKKIVNHLDFGSTTALRFGITAAMAFILILVTGSFLKFNLIVPAYWPYFLIIVFTSGAAAMFIYYYGLKKIPASAATICELFWPLSAIFLDYVINKNVLNFVQIIASAILIICFYKIIKTGQPEIITFSAPAISGVGRGEKLGFPTINLDKNDLNIENGVYLVEAAVDEKNYFALMHFGPKETFSEKSSLELYIEQNIKEAKYKIFKVKIIKKIRNIIRFTDEAGLKEQLVKDLVILHEYKNET
jgi:drug/metabolite transporter (DMT)-like permease